MPSEPADWPRIRTIGVDGFLVSFADTLSEPANRAALALRAALDRAGLRGVEETATSLTSTYLRFDLGAVDHATLHSALSDLLEAQDWYSAALPDGRRYWVVPAVFGTELAPQLHETAALVDLSPEAAIDAICAQPLRVQTIGFAPGQPYLGQLPEAWDIPRQTDLTPKVPEGALVVAIRQVVLFSVTTPTGWRHIGQTALRLFRPDEQEPFLLHPGDEVTFEAVSREAYERIKAEDPLGGATSRRLA